MAPVAWSMLELTAYGLASHACFPGYEPRMTLSGSWLQPLLLGVGVLALVVGLAGLTASWRSLRCTADEHRGATGELLEVGEGRTRFLAIWGVLAGGGGEGPALSDSQWIYGSEPANIYLTIVHGRPNGMPAWSAMVPDQIVWELVAYIQSIAEPPGDRLGRTISRRLQTQQVEQVPAEMLETTQRWRHVEQFAAGQRPAAQGGPAQAAGG